MTALTYSKTKQFVTSLMAPAKRDVHQIIVMLNVVPKHKDVNVVMDSNAWIIVVRLSFFAFTILLKL